MKTWFQKIKTKPVIDIKFTEIKFKGSSKK